MAEGVIHESSGKAFLQAPPGVLAAVAVVIGARAGAGRSRRRSAEEIEGWWTIAMYPDDLLRRC